MVRKSPTEWEIPPLIFDYLPFNPKVLRRILEETKVTKSSKSMSLAIASDMLNGGARDLRLWKAYHESPTEAASLDVLERIRTQATALRQLLRIVDQEGLDGLGACPRVVDGVAHLLIHEMPGLMQARLQRGATQEDDRRTLADLFGAEKPDRALLILAELLDLVVATVDFKFTHGLPGREVRLGTPVQRFAVFATYVYLGLSGLDRPSFSRSADTNKVEGPLIRFVEACCSHLGESVGRETLAKWIQGWRKRRQGKADLHYELGGYEDEDVDEEGDE